MKAESKRKIMNLDFGKYYEAPEPGRRERAEIIPGLLASIRKAASGRREYGKGKLKSRG